MALKIYAFDLMITNPDRGNKKDNVITNGSEFLIFDHELAFSYLVTLFKSTTPWLLVPKEKELYSNHVFYKYLKGEDRDFTKITLDYERLDSAFWQKVDDLLPDDWKSNEIKEIRNYLAEIVSRKEEFADQLTQTLFQ